MYTVPGELNRSNLGTINLPELQFVRERRLAGIIHEDEVRLQEPPAVHAIESLRRYGEEEAEVGFENQVGELAKAFAKLLAAAVRR